MNTEQLRSELRQVNQQESVVRVATPIDDHVMVTDAAPVSLASDRQKMTDADQ